MSELQEQEQVIDVWAKHREKVQTSIIKALRKRPHTIPELAKALNLSYHATHNWILRLADHLEIIEEGKAIWIGLEDHRYDMDLSTADIEEIPECWFYKIPIIQDWFKYADTRGRKDDLRTFRNICYGKVVLAFKVHPVDWQHPETTRRFRDLYEKQYNAPFKPHIRDAVRTFLQLCHGVKLSKYDSAIFGLKVMQPAEGKYRYLKLEPEEFNRAMLWLESEPCKQLCEQSRIRHTALLAHWSIAVSSFGRPSAVLALETRAIRNYKGDMLNFPLRETKQGKTFDKYVKEARLVRWAEAYWKFRLEQNMRYLFVTDLTELPEIRKKYNAIYKALFNALGKQEPVWYDDSLYCLRHVGIQRWIQNYGFVAVPMLQTMGFPYAKTLFDHYAGLSPDDFLKATKILESQVIT